MKNNATMKELVENYNNNFCLMTPKNDLYFEVESIRTNAIYDLAFAIGQCVVKRLLDPRGTNTDERKPTPDSIRAGSLATDNNGRNKEVANVRNDLVLDMNHLANLETVMNNEVQTYFNTNGDKMREVKETDYIHNRTLSDGVDLVHVAVESLINNTTDRLLETGHVDIEEVYAKEELSRRVHYYDGDCIPYRTVETSIMREAIVAVRRYIASTGSVKLDPTRCPYTYIEDLVKIHDDETNKDTYDLVGTYTRKRLNPPTISVKIDGKAVKTCTTVTAKELNCEIEKLNLTAKQATVLKCKFLNMSNHTIADKLKVDRRMVIKHQTAILKKFKAVHGDEYGVIGDRDGNPCKALTQLHFELEHGAFLEAFARDVDHLKNRNLLEKVRRFNATTPTVVVKSDRIAQGRPIDPTPVATNRLLARSADRCSLTIAYVVLDASRPTISKASDCNKLINLARNDTYMNCFAPCPISMIDNMVDNFKREYWKIRQDEYRIACAISAKDKARSDFWKKYGKDFTTTIEKTDNVVRRSAIGRNVYEIVQTNESGNKALIVTNPLVTKFIK